MRAESAWRVVIDTNVWISAFLVKTGAPAELVRLVLAHGEPVFSAATLAELDARLWRPKFDRYLDMDERQRLLRDLNSLACWITVPPAIAARTYCRDVDDDKMIHAALAAQATLLVTGDDDLLCLHPLGDLNILTPRAALEQLRNRRGQ